MAPSTTPHSAPDPTISFREAFGVWVRVALLSFGGPAGQIAVMHRILVEEKRWVSEARFLHALNYCMLLPGPEAQQLATYLGWVLHRWRGGLTAGLLFVLPGFAAILILSLLYAGYRGSPTVDAIFYGLKPAVVAVVIAALVHMGRRALGNATFAVIATLSFVAIFFFEVPFPFIIVAAALIGGVGGKLWPARFESTKPTPAAGTTPTAIDDALATRRPQPARTVRTAALWLIVWWVPIGALLLVLGSDHVLSRTGVFFSQTAVVTFGGAYAVLAYVAQQAVETYGWLRPGEMLDGLGMAETTPGPLIQVVQFVGFMAAYRNPGSWDPWFAGLLGSLVVTWATFAPCFLWIFVGAPFVESLRGRKRLTSALSSITAAVVGVILNLAVWFALHVLFGEVRETHTYGLRLTVPTPSTIDPVAAWIAIAALIALVRFKVGMLPTLAGSVVLGAAWFAFGK